VPVDLVIDHSVMVDEFGTPKAFGKNVELEYKQQQERYEFLKWGQKAFDNFRSCRPAPASATRSISNISRRRCGPQKEKMKVDGKKTAAEVAYPDTLVGTDSHTTMVNGLGARLGRRRHRGRGRDARPAGLDADPRSGRLPLNGN
jgi:aconitate hydratase